MTIVNIIFMVVIAVLATLCTLCIIVLYRAMLQDEKSQEEIEKLSRMENYYLDQHLEFASRESEYKKTIKNLNSRISELENDKAYNPNLEDQLEDANNILLSLLDSPKDTTPEVVDDVMYYTAVYGLDNA